MKISNLYFAGAIITFLLFLGNVNFNKGGYADVISFFDGVMFTCGIIGGIMMRVQDR